MIRERLGQRGRLAKKKESRDGESSLFHSGVCRPIPLTERAVQLKLALKIYGKRHSKKFLKGLNEVLALGPNVLKVSPTKLSIKEPGKTLVTVGNSDIGKFGMLHERQIPLKVYTDRRGPRTVEKLVK